MAIPSAPIMNRRPGPAFKLDTEEQAALIKAYSEGESPTRIAKNFNITKQTLYNYLHRNGAVKPNSQNLSTEGAA